LDTDAHLEPAADRRPSITRLAFALRQVCPGATASLCLPLCLLFSRHMRFDAADGFWADRDRLVLAPALSPIGAVLAELTGTGAGLEETLPQTMGAAAGMALAERLLASRFGRSLVDHRVWVFMSGADLATGSVQEAAWLAGAWRLGRLTAIAHVAARGAPGLSGFAAAGWSVRVVPAGDAGAIAAALSAALRSQKPTLIGVAGQPAPAPCFEDGQIEESRVGWLATGRRGAGVRRAWLKRLARHGGRPEFETAIAGRLHHGLHEAMWSSAAFGKAGAAMSTETVIRAALPKLASAVPELAILPGSPAWRQAAPGDVLEASRDAAGRMAQGMAAVMAGAALHGGVLPLVAHGLGEADSVGPALRMAASSGLRLIQVLIEDAHGCDAPGAYAALRATPNLFVFRPADVTEALECAELAFRRSDGPSVLILSDAPVPPLSDRHIRSRCARGGYVVMEAPAPRAATLIASGPELAIALQAQGLLQRQGVAVAVVSLPCWNFFALQDQAWQDAVLGHAPRIGLEAGTGFGWERWLGRQGLFIGAETAAGARCGRMAAEIVAERLLRHLEVPQST
jgi:transketolase